MKRDFTFAFNSKDFSDRILHVEILPDSWSDSGTSDLDGGSEPMEKSVNKRQKREPLEKSLNKRQKGFDQKKKKRQKGEHLKEQGEVAPERFCEHSNCEILHVNSAVLASCSPFFFKLFKSGMRESTDRHPTLRIEESEEVPLRDLLSYMYTNILSASTTHSLVKVLKIADKFEVTSCKRHCGELLSAIPPSLEFATSYLELPPSVLLGKGCEALNKIRDELQHHVGQHFKDFTKCEEEAMILPLSALEAVLGSDGLEVRSEDDVFRFIIQWSRQHYPKLEERREILTKRLARFLYFPYLNMSTLEEIQACDEFDSSEITKIVMESLYLNSGLPYGQSIHLPTATTSTNRHFTNRVYQFLPIKTMHLESPLGPSCVVYFNIPNATMRDLSQSEKLQYSQRFRLGGRWFFLCLESNRKDNTCEVGLSVELDAGSETCTFGFEFSALMDLNKGFHRLFRSESTTLKGGEFVAVNNLLRVPQGLIFGARPSVYLIKGVLHLQVQLTIKN